MRSRLLLVTLPALAACATADDTSNPADDTSSSGFALTTGSYVHSGVTIDEDACGIAKQSHPEHLEGTATQITEVTESTVVFNGGSPGEMQFVRDGNTLTWERVDVVDGSKEGIDCTMTVTGRFDDEIVADNTIDWVNRITAEGTGTECEMPIPCATQVSGRLTLETPPT